MSVAEKLTTIAENQQRVYEAGKAEGIEQGKQAEYDRLVDPAKIIEKTVGGSVIRVDDVSEIPHKCTVSVDKDATVTVCGKNLIPYPYKDTTKTINGLSFTDNGDGSITIDGTATALSIFYLNLDHLFGDTSINAITLSNGATNGTYAASRLQYYNGGNGILSINIDTGLTFDNETIYPQVELGTTATAWEQYQSTSHTITAGQTIEVDSLCPTMTLFADNDATITLGYHKSWGMQTEYDRFWDAYQQNGNKTNYDQAFGYTHWTDETYNPKYDIVCSGGTSARQMFYNGRMTSTKVPIRVKNASLNNTFAGSSIKTIVLLELVGVTSYNNPFSTCTALENITIEGSIDASFNISATAVLTDTSVQSIIDHLKDLTGATAQTLTFHATVGAKLTDAQKATITAKNWTLVY